MLTDRVDSQHLVSDSDDEGEEEYWEKQENDRETQISRNRDFGENPEQDSWAANSAEKGRSAIDVPVLAFLRLQKILPQHLEREIHFLKKNISPVKRAEIALQSRRQGLHVPERINSPQHLPRHIHAIRETVQESNEPFTSDEFSGEVEEESEDEYGAD